MRNARPKDLLRMTSKEIEDLPGFLIDSVVHLKEAPNVKLLPISSNEKKNRLGAVLQESLTVSAPPFLGPWTKRRARSPVEW